MPDVDPTTLSAADLSLRRYELLAEVGYLDLEMERRRAQKRIHVPASESRFQAESNLRPTALPIKVWRSISPELGFDVHTMYSFIAEIPPRTEGGRYHRHGEAIKYYLSGRAVELVGDEEYQVGPGDFIFIPANTWHGTQNPYDEPVRFLAVAQLPGTCVQKAAPFIDQTV